MFSMKKQLKDEGNWTYIRIKKETVNKLKQKKLDFDVNLYDEVLNLLLNKNANSN